MPRFPLVMLLVFALTLFTSATLLFLVQPMIGKMILPLLGGTPEVWNTCMVFFQAMLLAGYAYAHATTPWLGVRRGQARLHLVILCLPILLFFVVGPIVVNKSFIVGGANPIPGVLLVLLVSVGLPFFVVSTTSPLLQQWFSSTDHPSARDPYFLSTASNLGSMLALIGYPALVEPLLSRHGQRFGWAIGYGAYILLTGTCAVLLWKSGLAAAETPDPVKVPEAAPAPAAALTEERSNLVQSGKSQRKSRQRKGERSERIVEQPVPLAAVPGETALTGTVTLERRLRWIMLAFVPSSLLMGVTTYMTTDIAAIPLLWVLPLGLYLLSFILVFSKLPRWVHQVMILIMPLLVLLLVFMMFTEFKPNLGYNIMFHLLVMFVVAMVCHGEMVRDRPPTKYLTEFYMWMSFGGVLGGIFNALIAPVIFNSLAEYWLAMVAACMLLPALIPNEPEEETGNVGRTVDLSLIGLFTVVGLFLLWLRLREMNIPFARISFAGWAWPLAAVVLTLVGGAFYVLRSPVRRDVRALDIVLPMSLLLLTIGLIWGLRTKVVYFRLLHMTEWLPGDVKEAQFRLILTYGLPAVLCYTFVERSLRFGLGVGAILLAGTFAGQFAEYTLFEKRSFFGVLKVEVQDEGVYVKDTTSSPLLLSRLESARILDDKVEERLSQGKDVELRLANNRLVHGTTLHGKQFVYHQMIVPVMAAETVGCGFGDPLAVAVMALAGSTEDYSQQALTYYHRTGPIGHVMQAFNRSAADRLGVIGLGTGTLACYSRPGQSIVYYEIDKNVIDVARDQRYFTFLRDAAGRRVDVQMVLGDARLEIERWLDGDKKGLPRQGDYAILVVDAFSSDAIPLHLITREAVRRYMEMVREDGVLTFHISNRYLDLRPVLANIAKAEGLAVAFESDVEGGLDLETVGKSASTWVVFARKQEHLEYGVDAEGKKYGRLMTQSRWDAEREASEGLVLQLQMLLDRMAALHPPMVDLPLLAMEQLVRDWPPTPPKGRDPKAGEWPEGSIMKAPWQPITKPKEKDGVWTDDVWTDDYSNLLKVFMW